MDKRKGTAVAILTLVGSLTACSSTTSSTAPSASGSSSAPSTSTSSTASTGASATSPSTSVAPSASASGTTSLAWWARVQPVHKDEVKEFNTSHPNIQVTLTEVPDDQFVNKVGTGVRSTSGPDVLEFDVANGPLFAATGVLGDITERVNALDYKDALDPGMGKLGRYGDKTFSVPSMAGPSILLYNRDLFKQAGLPDKAPTTWQEIMDDAKKIHALGKDIYGFDIPGACGGCLAFTAQPLIWASGGQTMTDASPDQKTTYATSPQVADAFNFYHDMWKAGVANPAGQTQAGATWGQDFTAGKLGILLAGAWLIPAAEKAGHHVGVGPIPGKSGDFATFAGGNNIGVTSRTKKADVAWTFIQWLLEKEQQQKRAAAGNVPVRGDALTDAMAAKYPEIAAQLDVSKKSNGPDSIATNALQLSATSPWLAAFQSIVFQDKDAATALAKADDDSRKLIQQAYAQVPQ